MPEQSDWKSWSETVSQSNTEGRTDGERESALIKEASAMQNERAENTSSPVNEEVERWLAIRKKAASQIDPATAEVTFEWGYIVDPYGIHGDLPDECRCIGRIYFARAPESEIWVCFYDLPSDTLAAIRARLSTGEPELTFAPAAGAPTEK
jgi:hypothetical protein